MMSLYSEIMRVLQDGIIVAKINTRPKVQGSDRNFFAGLTALQMESTHLPLS